MSYICVILVFKIYCVDFVVIDLYELVKESEVDL